jgi:hypothetical protein
VQTDLSMPLMLQASIASQGFGFQEGAAWANANLEWLNLGHLDSTS